MASKQTLKSLLGGSDSRKQVSLDLGTPALRPAVQRAGQYSVAVQATPKTNSALQLAQALRYTPQVLGQVNNIAKTMGAEAAVNATDVEGEMLDDETKGILGYDKAYQQGLVKRHFSMNEETIKTRFKNLASNEEFLQMDPNEFLGALQGERQRFNDELLTQFGGNGNREQAINALSSTFVDDILDATTAEWTTNKKQQTEMFISADAQSMFEKHGILAGGLQYMSQEFAGLGMAPKERAEKQRGAVEAHIGVLMSQGKFQKVQEALDGADDYNIHGKAKLFGTSVGKAKMMAMRNALERSQNESESTLKERMAVTSQSFDVVPTALLSSLPFEQKNTSMLQALDQANVDPEVAQAELNKNVQEGMSSNDMWQGWKDTVTALGLVASDDSKALLNSVQDDLLRITKDGIFAKAIKGTTTVEQYQGASQKIQEYLLKNPTATLRDVPLGYNISKTDPNIQELFETHGAAVEWRNNDASQYDFVVQKNTAALLASSAFGEDQNEYATKYRSLMQQEAQNVYDTSGRDLITFNTDIVTKSKEIIGDLNEQVKRNKRLDARLKDTITSYEARTTSINQALEKNETGYIFKETPYPLLQGSTPQEGTTEDEQKQINSALIKERIQMFDDDEAQVLMKGSLLVYGFPTLESYDENVRLKARIGFQDFALGKEVRNTLSQAARGWDSEDPTPEQQKAIQFWKNQGYRSSGEILDIVAAQASYHSLNY
jgi:hypothetical protein